MNSACTGLGFESVIKAAAEEINHLQPADQLQVGGIVEATVRKVEGGTPNAPMAVSEALAKLTAWCSRSLRIARNAHLVDVVVAEAAACILPLLENGDTLNFAHVGEWIAYAVEGVGKRETPANVIRQLGNKVGLSAAILKRCHDGHRLSEVCGSEWKNVQRACRPNHYAQLARLLSVATPPWKLRDAVIRVVGHIRDARPSSPDLARHVSAVIAQMKARPRVEAWIAEFEDDAWGTGRSSTEAA